VLLDRRQRAQRLGRARGRQPDRDRRRGGDRGDDRRRRRLRPHGAARSASRLRDRARLRAADDRRERRPRRPRRVRARAAGFAAAAADRRRDGRRRARDDRRDGTVRYALARVARRARRRPRRRRPRDAAERNVRATGRRRRERGRRGGAARTRSLGVAPGPRRSAAERRQYGRPGPLATPRRRLFRNRYHRRFRSERLERQQHVRRRDRSRLAAADRRPACGGVVLGRELRAYRSVDQRDGDARQARLRDGARRPAGERLHQSDRPALLDDRRDVRPLRGAPWLRGRRAHSAWDADVHLLPRRVDDRAVFRAR